MSDRERVACREGAAPPYMIIPHVPMRVWATIPLTITDTRSDRGLGLNVEHPVLLLKILNFLRTNIGPVRPARIDDAQYTENIMQVGTLQCIHYMHSTLNIQYNLLYM